MILKRKGKGLRFRFNFVKEEQES